MPAQNFPERPHPTPDTIPLDGCLIVMGMNDGGIKRGDSIETGDEEAQPTAGREPDDELELLGESDLDDLAVLNADDQELGLTDIDAVPPQDWAADTGPTRSAEDQDRIGWDPLGSRPTHENARTAKGPGRR